MEILVVGSGGREHVLCQKIYESKITKKYFVFQVTQAQQKLLKILI